MKRILILLGLCCILTACNNTEVDIQVNTIISDITAEEFSYIAGKNQYGTTNQKNFQKLTFNFSMEHGSGVNRNIEMFDDWILLINGYDGLNRYWGGSGGSRDNDGENFASYQREFIFYSKGLNDKELKELFKDARITVEWEANKEKQTKEIFIADTIIFKE